MYEYKSNKLRKAIAYSTLMREKNLTTTKQTNNTK